MGEDADEALVVQLGGDMKAIVLAGGRGTRMGTLSDKTPKPLIQIGGRPLIERVIEKLSRAGIADVIVSTGYLAEQFAPALGDGSRWGVQLEFSVEDSPRGTGGAMALAAQRFLGRDDVVVVVNADLISDHSLDQQYEFHLAQNADVTLHVREVEDPRRFGVVRFDRNKQVTEFIEKPDVMSREWINAGTYLVRASILLDLPEAYPLSWEREVLPELIASGARILAFEESAYFRDVGTVADIPIVENDLR